MYHYYNPNPRGKNVGDCAVRALAKALRQDWYTTFFDLCIEGAILADMPSGNSVWGSYLKRKGFHREIAQDDITVAEFIEKHPAGTYILALSGHVVCAQGGVLYDSWNSENETVLYHWAKER